MSLANRHKINSGFIIALAGAILHSGKAIFTKLAYAVQPIDGSTVLALRMLFALPIYLLLFFLFNPVNNTNPSVKSKNIMGLALVVGLSFYFSALLDFEGLKFVTASMERLILFIYPSLVLLFTWIFYHKKVRPYQYLALVLTYTGILIAFLHEAQAIDFNHEFIKGSILIFCCSCIYAWYIIRNGHLIALLGVQKSTSITMIICSVAAILYFGLQHDYIQLLCYKPSVYWLSFAMAIISTVLPTYMIAYGIKKIGSGDAAIVNSAGPVSTIIQAHFILGENIGIYQVAGTLLVIVGIWMIGTRKTSTK